MNENIFQKKTMSEIRALFPGCITLKNDSGYCQGIPDFLVLYDDKWACLEFKKSEYAGHRPNQDYYISLMDNMSFARFIYPENKEQVLNDLVEYFTVE